MICVVDMVMCGEFCVNQWGYMCGIVMCECGMCSRCAVVLYVNVCGDRCILLPLMCKSCRVVVCDVLYVWQMTRVVPEMCRICGHVLP